MSSVEGIIREKLSSAFSPAYFEVVNESFKHNVPSGSESHFKVVVVADVFEGKSLVERHRMINQVLRDELSTSIHALSIQAKTVAQWDMNPLIQQTPNCLGGDKKKSFSLTLVCYQIQMRYNTAKFGCWLNDYGMMI